LAHKHFQLKQAKLKQKVSLQKYFTRKFISPVKKLTHVDQLSVDIATYNTAAPPKDIYFQALLFDDL